MDNNDEIIGNAKSVLWVNVGVVNVADEEKQESCIGDDKYER